jgi:hypothetical protein
LKYPARAQEAILGIVCKDYFCDYFYYWYAAGFDVMAISKLYLFLKKDPYAIKYTSKETYLMNAIVWALAAS